MLDVVVGGRGLGSRVPALEGVDRLARLDALMSDGHSHGTIQNSKRSEVAELRAKSELLA